MAERPTKEGKYLSDFRDFERRLPSDGAEWFRPIRQQAISRFTELGFPKARRGNEKWKYTSVVPLANATFEYPFDFNVNGLKASDLRRFAPWDDSWVNFIFVNGRYSEALSTPQAESNGVRVENLADVIAMDPDMVAEHLTGHASFEDDGFIALNTAFLRDGAFVHVPEGEAFGAPLHLLYVSTHREQPTVSYPRTLVLVDRHSKVTVIESYINLSSGPCFTDAVTEIVIDEGAEVEHYRVLVEGPDAFHVGNSRVHQAQDSTFSSTCFAKGAAMARNDLNVLLDAPGSSCSQKGLYMTTGKEHIDNYINIDHAKPHTTSRLYYKGILDGKSRAVFGGTVLVRQNAQKADAQQADKNLILSEDAEVDSKPSLLIYADDVKCGHGATAGHINEDAVFYMRSRGLDQETATVLLIRGFASEIIDAVQIESLLAYLESSFSWTAPNLQHEATS